MKLFIVLGVREAVIKGLTLVLGILRKTPHRKNELCSFFFRRGFLPFSHSSRRR